jgi:uncharacterized lipoprotein YbaY
MAVVRGWVELPRGLELPRPVVTLRVRVEDVSRADAPARRLGEASIDVDAAAVVRGEIAFSVAAAEPDQGATCSLRAHLDVDADGGVSPGDYVSTERIPVLHASAPPETRVRLRRVA